MGRFLDRYLRGECKQVWDELLTCGEEIRREPLFTDASAVAHETMRRVRYNIEILIPRLRSLGYEFGEFSGQDPCPHWTQAASSPEESSTFLPFVPPHPEIQQLLEQLEQAMGPLPLSLHAFYLEVGGVNFLGIDSTSQRLISLGEVDPLYIDPLIPDALSYYLSDYAYYKASPGNRGGQSFEIPLAPDFYHKYNTSGDGPYCMTVPNAHIDGLFLYEWHNTTFVDYLRVCFLSGGLPPSKYWTQTSREATEVLTYLQQDLLPI